MGGRWILFAGFMARMRLPTSGVGGGGQEKDKSEWGVSVCRERPLKLSGSGIADRSNFIV